MLFAMLVSAVLAVAHAVGPADWDRRLLAVLEDGTVESSHSRFLGSLKERGYVVDVRGSDDDAIPLLSEGEYQYGGIVLLAPRSTSLARALPISAIDAFIESGRSIFLAASNGFSDHTLAIARSIGVDLDSPTSVVRDHQSFVPSLDANKDHTFIRAGGRAASTFLFGSRSQTDGCEILFRGPGASLFVDNELVDSVIWGSGSSYTYAPQKPVVDSPHASGSGLVLGAALHTRAGSRAVYFGSFDALADDVFASPDGGAAHETAMTSLSAWAFGHTGVLRTSNVQYRVIGESRNAPGRANDGKIRVKDELEFSMDVDVWNGAIAAWQPFVAHDMQLEFVMLNPWVRTRLGLGCDGSDDGASMCRNTTYHARFRVPDQIGVYKFVVSYYRVGTSSIELRQEVSVRPFLHNEYPRFLQMAYPYYLSSFIMLGSVLMLGLVLKYGNPEIAMANVKAASRVDTPATGASRDVASVMRRGRRRD